MSEPKDELSAENGLSHTPSTPPVETVLSSRTVSRPGACVEMIDVKMTTALRSGLDIGGFTLRGAR